LFGNKPVKDPSVHIVTGYPVFQKQKPFESDLLGDTKAFDVFPAFGPADNG
jgi:hypothetical protein